MIRDGRTFLRHLFSILARSRSRHHYIHLDNSAQADLRWWACFLLHWCGRSFFCTSPLPLVHVYTVASGTVGCVDVLVCSRSRYNKRRSCALCHTWLKGGCRTPPSVPTSPLAPRTLISPPCRSSIIGCVGSVAHNRTQVTAVFRDLQILFTAWLIPSTGTFFDRSMLLAACCLRFFGFMQSSEFICPSDSLFQDDMLTLRDVAVDSHYQQYVVLVLLRRSKTDPFGQGVTVFVGQTAHAICPVAAILSYLAQQESECGSLFWLEDGSSLGHGYPLCPAVPKGFPSRFVGHFGLPDRGCDRCSPGELIQDSTIQTLGR